MKHKAIIITVFISLITISTSACTSVIISGRATPDGRPLMWKHRDTEVKYNHIAYFSERGYPFIGLVNSGDTKNDVWCGTNSHGFSIMNTASFNLKNDTVTAMDHEGAVMRRALEICRTLADFETFLDTLSRPMRVEANFGVIDAYGGAAYYETDNYQYVKKDVNDPKLAPNGYIVYTNFSFEGRKDEGYGFIRYESASKIFADMAVGGFTPQRIIQQASRSFYNSMLGIDLRNPDHDPNKTTGWALEQDMIPRSESTAAIVIQGVSKGMNPELTTMWTSLGYPPTAITVPLWVKMGNNQPSIVTCREKDDTAPLCLWASQLKEKVYPIPPKRGSGKKYLKWSLLWNQNNSGFIQQLEITENEIFKLSEKAIKAAEHNNSVDAEQIEELYDRISSLTEKSYQKLL